jgi:hypothetical protein
MSPSAFNMIGIIDVTDMETHQVVNVEFHDKGSRRGYHFQDNNRFQLAAVGKYAARLCAALPDSLISLSRRTGNSVCCQPGRNSIHC